MPITMDAKKARSIIKEAKKKHGDEDPVYEGPVPRDDDKAVEEAQDLIEMAHQAKKGGFESEAVTQVLFLAEVDGGSSSDPNTKDDAGGGDEDQPEELKPPWRGYDARKVDQIKTKLPKLDDDELAVVFEYESANKNRTSIISLIEKLANERGIDQNDGSAEDGADEPEGTQEPDEEPSDPDDETSASDDDYDPEHHELIEEVTKRIKAENLSVPARLPEDVVELPFDFTELGDRNVRQYHSAFTNYFARTKYLVMLEEQLEMACKHAADRKMNRVIAEMDKSRKDGKEKTATEIKAEAEADDEVDMWRDRQLSHGRIAGSHRDELEIYSQNITSLSREWTMRSEELDHTGQLKGRGKR